MSAFDGDVLHALLGVSAETFFESYYERRPLRGAPGDPGAVRDLLTLERLDRKLAEHDLREGTVSLVNQAQLTERDVYIEDGFVNRAAVARQFRAGATVIWNQLQHSDLAAADLCRALEKVFSCHVQANVYLTPPKEQGFLTHYDSHDVLVVQLSGSKLWRVYEDPADTPYRGERFQRGQADGKPVAEEFELREGESLYLPRGWYHDASNVDETRASLHVTIGLIAKTWADLVLESVSEVCLKRPEFRRALPPGHHAAGAEALSGRFAELMQILAREADPTNAHAGMVETFVTTREPAVVGSIADQRFADDAPLKATGALRLIRREGDETVVLAPGGTFRFRRAPEEIVRRVLDGAPFTIGELDHEAARDMVERLAAGGLIRRA